MFPFVPWSRELVCLGGKEFFLLAFGYGCGFLFIWWIKVGCNLYIRSGVFIGELTGEPERLDASTSVCKIALAWFD